MDVAPEHVCERCGAELLANGELLHGMCLRCMSAVKPPTCQGYSP